jgi:hypothetical protein
MKISCEFCEREEEWEDALAAIMNGGWTIMTSGGAVCPGHSEDKVDELLRE